MKTAPILDWARKRRGAELAASPLAVCSPMTDWAGCTTVMIGRPSPKTFPSILNNMYVCAAVDMWTTWERSGWDKGTWAPSKVSLGQMQAQSFRLGEKEGATLGG